MAGAKQEQHRRLAPHVFLELIVATEGTTVVQVDDVALASLLQF